MTVTDPEIPSQHEALRRALIEGEQSGIAIPFDFEEFIASKRKASAGERAEFGSRPRKTSSRSRLRR